MVVEKVARVATRVATKAVVVTKEVEAVDSREVEMDHQVPSLFELLISHQVPSQMKGLINHQILSLFIKFPPGMLYYSPHTP